MPIAPVDDIIQLIGEDHELIKKRLADVSTAPKDLRVADFWQLMQELVRHEVAEEVVVYPAVRKLPGGEAIADSCIAEQAESERQLADMEDMDANSDRFTSALADLTRAVIDHARHEEKDVLSIMAENEPSTNLLELGERYRVAKNAAPTHPHPNAPDTPPGNKILGPMAALFDRVRDEISSVV